MTGKMEGRREKGRPRKKYLDAMKEIVEGRWTDAQIRRRMKNREGGVPWLPTSGWIRHYDR